MKAPKTIWINPDFTKIITDVNQYEYGCFYYELVSDKRLRSLDQNAKYWKMVEIISNESGYAKDELHLYFKYSYIAIPMLRLLNQDPNQYDIATFLIRYNQVSELKAFMEYVSTTILDTKEFTIYIEKIEEFAQNFDIQFN